MALTVDIIGGILILLFVVIDFLRGALRVVGGLLALVAASVATYLFYENAGQLISDKWNVILPISYVLGGMAVYLLSYIPGLFLFPFMLKKFFKGLHRIEDLAVEEDAPAPAPVAGQKQATPAPLLAKKAEEEIEEEVAEEMEITLMSKLLGGVLGALKGSVIMGVLFFVLHLFPTPDFIQNALRESFFCKVYRYYVASPLEKQSVQFKVLNNMGYIIEVASKIEKKPNMLEDLKDYPPLQELGSLKPVKDFLKDKKFVQWARDNPVEALQDERVKALLDNPAVKEKITALDMRKMRNYVRGLSD